MMTSEEHDTHKANLRHLRAMAIAEEIEGLLETADPDDETFDIFIAALDEMVQDYRRDSL